MVNTKEPEYETYSSHRPSHTGTEHVVVRIAVERDGPGGCSVSVETSEGSSLVEKYGGVAAALAACREFIVKDLDAWIEMAASEGL